MPKSKTGVDLMNCSSDNSLYEEGEKVWASYSDKWYEAKVFMVVESSMTAKRYLVHYPGKAKQSNEDIQNQLATNTKSGDKGKAKESEEILLAEENMNIEIPRMLKKQLVDDSEFVTRLGKLVKLPRTPNVDDILKKYFRFKVKKNNIHPSSDMLSGNRLRDEIQEILYRIRYYFDKALPTMLLYSNERKQYEALSAENIPPSVAYGAEHLLRLFVMLPEILQDVNIEEEMRMKLEHEILGLIKFLQENQSTFFLYTYQTPEDLDPEKK
ncbi:protein MRG2-like [Apium graveolens]|uniref:protein MRG2-like n=1 Tax=Apium graveolens TaxID=4045 RepID=UPI003D79B7DB